MGSHNVTPANDLVDLDLTDEVGLLCADTVENDPADARARLAALNLRAPGTYDTSTATVLDMAVYRATGDRHLASLFSRAA